MVRLAWSKMCFERFVVFDLENQIRKLQEEVFGRQ